MTERQLRAIVKEATGMESKSDCSRNIVKTGSGIYGLRDDGKYYKGKFPTRSRILVK